MPRGRRRNFHLGGVVLKRLYRKERLDQKLDEWGKKSPGGTVVSQLNNKREKKERFSKGRRTTGKIEYKR